jgi:hypothetical protein
VYVFNMRCGVPYWTRLEPVCSKVHRFMQRKFIYVPEAKSGSYSLENSIMMDGFAVHTHNVNPVKTISRFTNLTIKMYNCLTELL